MAGKTKKTTMERFEEKYIPEPMSGCWLWTGARDRQDYGLIRVKGRTIVAHRLSYKLYVGEIFSGWELDHLCRETSCVNPDHLEQVTRLQNVRRGDKNQNTKKTHCPQGHPYNETNTYIHGGRRHCRKCRREQALDQYYKKKEKVRNDSL